MTLAIDIYPWFPGCCAAWPCGEGSLQGDPWPRGRSTRPPWVRVDWEKSLKKRKTSRKEVKTERDDLITKQEMESALSVMKSQIVEEIRWAIACVRISATCIYVWCQSFLITRRLNLSFSYKHGGSVADTTPERTPWGPFPIQVSPMLCPHPYK